MWMRNRQLDPKTRRWMALGNISLVIGLLLWMFVHPAGQTAKDWHDGVCGFLLGLSITINLFGLRRARRCRVAEPIKL
jgi:hypothetical protein